MIVLDFLKFVFFSWRRSGYLFLAALIVVGLFVDFQISGLLSLLLTVFIVLLDSGLESVLETIKLQDEYIQSQKEYIAILEANAQLDEYIEAHQKKSQEASN